MDTWESALDAFLLSKRAEGRSHLTIRDYRTIVGNFFRDERAASAWPDVCRLKQAVLEHFAGLRDNAPSYYNAQRRILRSFFSWCQQEGFVNGNPTDGIRQRKEDRTPRHLEPETLKRLLSLPETSTYAGLRDRTLIMFQLDCAVRPGEALRLRPSDFNLAALEVVIPAPVAKTRQTRTVVLSPQTAKAIRKLLSVRPADWDDSVPVFASASGRPMPEATWGWRIRQYGKRLGVRTTPYMLRHSSAIMLLRGGAHAFAVQRQLGHSDLSMTRRYIELSVSDLHEQHAASSPVAQLLPQRTRARKVKR